MMVEKRYVATFGEGQKPGWAKEENILFCGVAGLCDGELRIAAGNILGLDRIQQMSGRQVYQ